MLDVPMLVPVGEPLTPKPLVAREFEMLLLSSCSLCELIVDAVPFEALNEDALIDPVLNDLPPIVSIPRLLMELVKNGETEEP